MDKKAACSGRLTDQRVCLSDQTHMSLKLWRTADSLTTGSIANEGVWSSLFFVAGLLLWTQSSFQPEL